MELGAGHSPWTDFMAAMLHAANAFSRLVGWQSAGMDQA